MTALSDTQQHQHTVPNKLATETGSRDIYRKVLRWRPDDESSAEVLAEIYRVGMSDGTVQHGITYFPGHIFLDVINARASRQWQQWFDGSGPTLSDACRWLIELHGDHNFDSLPFGADPKEHAGLVTLQAMAFISVVYALIMLPTQRALPEYQQRLRSDLSDPKLLPEYQRYEPHVAKMKQLILDKKFVDALVPVHYSTGMFQQI
jgi:hypothetical protein